VKVPVPRPWIRWIEGDTRVVCGVRLNKFTCVIGVYKNVGETCAIDSEAADACYAAGEVRAGNKKHESPAGACGRGRGLRHSVAGKRSRSVGV